VIVLILHAFNRHNNGDLSCNNYEDELISLDSLYEDLEIDIEEGKDVAIHGRSESNESISSGGGDVSAVCNLQ